MAWRQREDECRITDDIPGTRWAIVKVTKKKWKVYFLALMAVASGGLFTAGLIGLARNETLCAAMTKPPDSAVMMVIGLVGFLMFFPWMISFYFVRHLLWSVVRLEDELAKLKTAIQAHGTSPGGPGK